MRSHITTLLSTLTITFLTPIASSLPESVFSLASYHPSHIISRDVAVIGGGSTGTYSALRLRDSSKSVVVIEQQNRLGGHTETYIDPSSGESSELGVVVFHDLPLVRNYFARFNISLSKSGSGSTNVLNYDLRTGKEVTVSAASPASALGKYAAELQKYPYVESGFDLPDPVPADLILPFGEFAKKYEVEDVVQLVFRFAQGLGDLLAQPTLYVFKNFGLDIIRNLSVGFLTTTKNDNSELYEKATEYLGSDVLLSSTVLATLRVGDRVKVVVKTPEGIKLILAKKLLLTIPPKLENLKGFDLNVEELGLFGKFKNAAYYNALLRNTGIPANTSIRNSAEGTPGNIPILPGLYYLNPTAIPGVAAVKFGSDSPLPDSVVKREIVESIKRVAGPDSKPEFVVYKPHVPFEVTVSKQEIEKGFYRKLYGLQGKRDTWWTGAAFHTHDSSLLWEFTEKIVSRLVEEI